MSSYVFDRLLLSIRSNDFYICVAAMTAVFFLMLTIYFASSIAKRTSQWKGNKNINFSKFLSSSLIVTYSIFTTLISIFPLLGMLGTVNALLGLSLSTEDMLNVKSNFFDALTSTAWGIIFAILFKLVNALVSNFIENQIDDSKKMSEEINYIAPKVSR